MNTKFSLFIDDEKACFEQFDKKFVSEIDLFFRLLSHMESLVMQVSGKIKNNDYPNWTIEMFLAYNLTLLNSSYDRLRNGYLGVSQSLLRPAIENMALSMYFYEFPEDEPKYRRDRKYIFSKLRDMKYAGWMDGVMQRIDKEGTKFTKLDESKGQSWYKFLITNLGDEASNFLHSNPEYTYGIIYGDTQGNVDNYVLGPNWISNDLMKNGFWKVIEATLINTIIFDRIFKEFIPVNDIDLIRECVDKLNKWKEEYTKNIKPNDK